MSDTKEIVLDVPNVGLVHQPPGVGPWHVRQHGNHSFDIRDSRDAIASPTMTVRPFRSDRGWKQNANVVFAKLSDAKAVVDAFNARLMAETFDVAV